MSFLSFNRQSHREKKTKYESDIYLKKIPTSACEFYKKNLMELENDEVKFIDFKYVHFKSCIAMKKTTKYLWLNIFWW